jgi:hypothetical protein
MTSAIDHRMGPMAATYIWLMELARETVGAATALMR